MARKKDEKKRRQRGEGALYQRADGMWIGVVDLGWRDGKRRRKVVSSKSFKAAQKKLKDLKASVHKHGDIPTSDVTVEQWLTYWLEHIVFPNSDPETYTRYRSSAINHIIPELGRERLEKLQPHHVRQLHERFYDRGLSESSAASAHRTLTTALNTAMRERGLTRNVAALVGQPRIGEADEVSLELDEVRRFMETAARNPRTASRWLAAFLIGPRQGETLGLRWAYVDWDEQMMDISWQLKRLKYQHGCGERRLDGSWACGKKSAGHCSDATLRIPPGYECDQLYGRLCLTRPKNQRHMIPIPDPLFLALKLRRRQFESERGDYVSNHDLVWCRNDGEPIAHEDDYDEWVDWLSASGIEHVKLHAARHTAATMLRNLGYQSDVIKTVLGHASVLMTQRYTEIDARLAREALAGYGDALKALEGTPPEAEADGEHR